MSILSRLRKEMGLTQAQVAERVGTDRSTYAHIEIGRTMPSLALAYRIAKLYGRPIEELFGSSFAAPAEEPPHA